MLNKIKISIILLLTILCFQCKKITLVPSTQGEPVFFLSADIGMPDSLKFSAGLNNYRMFTSYELGTDSVFNFIGEFKKEADQIDSLASIRFEIRNFEINTTTVDIDNAVTQSSYDYFDTQHIGAVDSSFIVTFNATTMGCPQGLIDSAFHWDFGNGLTAIGYGPVMEFEDSNDRDVILTIDYGGGLETSIQQLMSFHNVTSNCSVDVSAFFQQNDMVLSAVGLGAAPFSYTWHDNQTSSSIIISNDTLGVDEYSVTVTDSNGCISVASGDIPPNIGNGICTSRFSYTSAITLDTLPASPQFSTLRIIYVDIDGNEFRSDLAPQHSDAFFDVQSVDNYSNNENGMKTKKLSIDFSCDLFSPTLPTVSIECQGASIGVAYPD